MGISVAFAVAKSMTRQLLKMGVALALSFALMQVSRELGVIVMMGCSSYMVVKSAKAEMLLGAFTALLPGIMSLLCFLFMFGFIGVYRLYMPLAGIALGIIPGLLMARGHRVYEKNGRLFAQADVFLHSHLVHLAALHPRRNLARVTSDYGCRFSAQRIFHHHGRHPVRLPFQEGTIFQGTTNAVRRRASPVCVPADPPVHGSFCHCRAGGTPQRTPSATLSRIAGT